MCNKKNRVLFAIILLLLCSSNHAFAQLKLNLNDSTSYQPGFETSFDINYQDTFVYLDSNTTETFRKIVDFHKKNPAFLLELGVHQDQMGSDMFNLKQSQIRSMRIIELLKDKFEVDISKFIVIGYGESRPIIKMRAVDADRYDQKGFRGQSIANLNRRISLKILKTD